MDKKVLLFTVSKQDIAMEQTALVASDTVAWIQGIFNLDDNWKSMDRVSAIWSNGAEVIETVLDADGACVVPPEVKTRKGNVRVNLVGSVMEDGELVERLTTYPIIAIIVDAKVRLEGSETQPVTPSQFEQYVAIVSDLVDSVKDIDEIVMNADYTLTIKYSDGTSYTTTSIRGEQGETGPQGPQGEPGPQGPPGEVDAETLMRILPTDSASGAIASFPDGSDLVPMQSLEVSIEPVQDLHGHDKPWAGGAGANKWDEEWENGRINITDGTDRVSYGLRSKNYIPCLPSTEYYFKKGTYDGGSGFVFFYGSDKSYINYTTANNSTFTTPNDAYFIRFSIFTDSAVTQYNHDTAVNYPSTVTTYSPYTNICPISGWDSVGAVVCGVNVWDEEWEVGSIYMQTGADSSTAGFCRSKYFRVVPNTTYFMKCPTAMFVFFYDENKAYLGDNYFATPYNSTFTTPPNVTYMRFRNGVANTWTPYQNDISINYPSTDHEYHAYSGHTYTTPLPSTVYGGTLDMVSGELTVDRASIDLSTLSPVYNSTWGCWYLSGGIDGAKVVGSNNDAVQAISSNMSAVKASGYTSSHNTGTFAQNTGGAWFFDNGDSSSLSGQLVYELAQPTTTQLTQQEIDCLLGTNNVWSECGDVAVVYSADIQRYVEKKL